MTFEKGPGLKDLMPAVFPCCVAERSEFKRGTSIASQTLRLIPEVVFVGPLPVGLPAGTKQFDQRIHLIGMCGV